MNSPSDERSWMDQAIASRRRLLDVPSPEASLVEAAIASADSAWGYFHWDQFQQLPLVDGWSAKEVWALVRLGRHCSARSIDDLLDKGGLPLRMVRTDVLLASLHRIDTQERLWKKLHVKGESPDAEATYRLMASIEEAHSTSAIAGATLTRSQSRELIRSGAEPRDRSERMVLNAMEALALVEERVGEPLTPALILALQKALTAGTLEDSGWEGAFRTGDDFKIVDAESGDTVYVPPPALELPSRLDSLCRFANSSSEGERFTHPVTRAILLHHQLCCDHPFVGGNGRTARILCMWSLLRSGYHWFRSLSISRAIERFKGRYYQSFLDVQSGESDVTHFVRVQLRCIQDGVYRLEHFLQRRLDLERWLREVGAVKGALNARQLALLDCVLENTEVRLSARDHGSLHQVTQPTAWKDLTKLRDEGLLDETKEGRKSIYGASQRLSELSKTRPERGRGLTRE